MVDTNIRSVNYRVALGQRQPAGTSFADGREGRLEELDERTIAFPNYDSAVVSARSLLYNGRPDRIRADEELKRDLSVRVTRVRRYEPTPHRQTLGSHCR